jgi:predicted nucleic acid-binding Zn ribbon protein
MAKRVHRIDQILRKTLRKMDLDVKLEGYRVWPHWDAIVGEQIAQRAQPERLRNRILFVKVSNSTWMHQLQTMKPLLLEKIREIVADAAVEDIRFFLGEVSRPNDVPPPRPQRAPRQNGMGLRREMEAYLESIRDPELKALVRSVMVKHAESGIERPEG